jgi:hypothetical protein
VEYAFVTTPALIAGAAAALVSAALAADAPSEPRGECPSPASLWSISQRAVTGTPWTFRLLEFDAGLARERSIEAWLVSPEPADEDRRWFARGRLAPVPSHVAVRSHIAPIEDYAELCAALAAAGSGSIQAAAGSACAEEERSIDADVRIGAIDAGTGYGVRAAPRPGDERCRRATGSTPALHASIVIDLAEPDPPAADAQADDPLPAAARETVAAWQAYLAEPRADQEPTGGLAALPVARALIDVALDLDPQSVPEALMSEPHLALAAGAPGAYVAGAAREALERPRTREQLLALLWLLGERPDPAARDDLRLALRRMRDDAEAGALALRALARTDAAIARREALPLLGGPTALARAALGVFAVTGSDFDRLLDPLDPTDEDALIAAGDAIVEAVATSATDDTLREAAADLRRRRQAGERD